MNDSQAAQEMPRYVCHKKVWALKIKEIAKRHPTIDELEAILKETPNRPEVHGAMITPEEKGYAPFGVTLEYLHKHQPEVGGYYVVYADGYKSYSPAKAFEEGYTLET